MREESVACKTELHIILLLLKYHVIIDLASQSLFYYLIALKYCTENERPRLRITWQETNRHKPPHKLQETNK